MLALDGTRVGPRPGPVVVGQGTAALPSAPDRACAGGRSTGPSAYLGTRLSGRLGGCSVRRACGGVRLGSDVRIAGARPGPTPAAADILALFVGRTTCGPVGVDRGGRRGLGPRLVALV